MPPVHIREQIILRFALREKITIYLPAVKLIRQFRETGQMISHSLSGVVFRGVVANEKGPIAGLRKEKLARQMAHATVVISSRRLAARRFQYAPTRARPHEQSANPGAVL